MLPDGNRILDSLSVFVVVYRFRNCCSFLIGECDGDSGGDVAHFWVGDVLISMAEKLFLV